MTDMLLSHNTTFYLANTTNWTVMKQPDSDMSSQYGESNSYSAFKI